jgi:PAS domain S-box-containing protein
MNENTRFADVLRRILATAANPATAGRTLADELLRFTAARMVVLVQEDVGALVSVVAPDNHRALVEHPVIAALLREVSEIETFRFYSSDTPIPGMDVILSPENQTNCLAVPLKSGGVRVGAVLVFGLAQGKEIDVVTGNVEKLAPLLAMVLHNALQLRQTRSKPSELVFRESNARFQELVHCLPVPVALYDAQGNFLLINDRMTAIYGYSLENVPDLSRYWPNAFPNPEARAQAQARWSAAVADAERIGSPNIAPEEYLVTCKDGTVRVTEVFGTRLGDAALVVFNDVTARRLAEAELEDHRVNLEKMVDERTREVRVREERLIMALEATNTGLWQWDPTTRQIDFSPTYYTMLGFEPGEFKVDQSTWPDLIHPDDRESTVETLREIALSPDDTAFNLEHRRQNKQGQWRWISTRGKTVKRDEQGRVCSVVGVNTDITERKTKEKRLQMAMQALNTTRECVYWIDQYGRMIYVNPATEMELGYSSDELLQMTIPDIDPNTPAEQWGPDGELTRRLNSEGLRKFLTQHRHRDGHLIPVEVDSDAFHYDGQTYFIAITRDISARLAAEDALRNSEAKFTAIFSLTPEPMALTRLADGTVLEASSSYADFFGFKRDELIGRTTLPGDLGLWVNAEQRRQWKEIVERDGEVIGFEALLRRKDGSTATVLISGKTLEMGGEKCVIVDLHDITERLGSEEALRKYGD